MNIVNKLTLRQLKENKRRTLVTIIGVIISVAMIMGVITIGTSFSEFMKKREIEADGYWHVKYENVTKDQINKIRGDGSVDKTILSKDLGYSVLKGSKNENKPYIFIKEFNKEGFENYPVKLVKGRLPSSQGEVVIPEHIATNGKVKYSIGDTLNLDIGNRYSIPKENEEQSDKRILDQSTAYLGSKSDETIVPTMKKEYKVVGIIGRPSFEYNWSPGYTVLSYIDKNNIGNSKVDASVILKKVNKSMFDNSKEFAKENNIEKVEFNNALLKWDGVIQAGELRRSLYSVVAVLIAVIMIGSVSLIYNAFAISVSERSKHLGMLSSVGATKRQKRNSVIFEAGIIGVISIPIGIIAGIAGIGITFIFVNPLLKSSMEIEGDLTLNVNLLAIVAAIIISAITIYISALIPALKASRITPIEAIRQTNDIKLTNKKIKTSKLTRKIFGIEAEIGLKNLKRNKRRYLTTIFSLVISIVLFLTVATFGMYMTKSLEFTSKSQNYDISIRTSDKTEKDKIDAFKRFTSLEGVKDYSITKGLRMETLLDENKIPEYIDKQGMIKTNGKVNYNVNLTSLDKESFTRYAKEVGADINALNNIKDPCGIVIDTAKYYANGKFQETKAINAKVGEKLSLIEAKEENKYKDLGSIKIEKLTNKLPMGMNYQENLPDINVIVSEEVLDNIASNFSDKEIAKLNIAYGTTLFIKSDDSIKLQGKMDEVSKDLKDNAYIYNIEEQTQRSKQTQMLFSIFIYGFIALITAISVANIFNTISTSIALRKKEFAMLKSVGMTPRDFNKMINYESIFYGIKSLMFGLPLGFLVMVLLHKTLAEGFEFGFQVPWLSVGIVIVGVFVIVGISMLYSSSKVKKENIIDALKQENI